MIWWELLPDVAWSHDVVRNFCVPPSEGSYGAVIDQDLKPAQKIITLKGHGLEPNDISTLETAVQARGQSYSATDWLGIEHTGTLLSLSYTGIQGLGLYDATIQLRV